MIYEGAVIRRLVTPHHPGAPELNDGNLFRTEYVLEDPQFAEVGLAAKTDLIRWTTNLDVAFRYGRHLDADRRARQISPHCYARVVPRATEMDFIPQDGEAVSRLAHNQKIVGSTPTPATNLPAEGSSTAGAVKQLPKSGVKKRHGTSGGNQSTSTRKTCPAGISFSARAAALRAAADRTAPNDRERFWWRQGQFA